MGMAVMRGKNLVFNSSFDIEAADTFFPMGWVPFNGDLGTDFEWSADKAVYGNHTVAIRNETYLDSMTGIVMDQRYSIEVKPGEEYELSAWMCTERPGVPLRLMAIYMKEDYSYLGETHFKFESTVEMNRYSGRFAVPAGAALLKVAAGAHDSEQSLPSRTWISWITLRTIKEEA